MTTTTRQFLRFILAPCSAAVSSAICHCFASASGPPGSPAPIDRTPTPWRPAAVMPNGVIVLATAIGKHGSVYGAKCNRAFFSSNQSVFFVTGSSHFKSSTIVSSDSTILFLCVTGSMASIYASDVSAPGPQPSIVLPLVMWSSCTNLCATINGL